MAFLLRQAATSQKEVLSFSIKPSLMCAMITIGMNYQVLPGKEEVFERAFDRVLETMRSSAGHTQSHLYKDVNEKNSYLIISDWNDKQAFDTFVKSEAFAKVTNWGKEQILAGRPKHQVFTPQA